MVLSLKKGILYIQSFHTLCPNVINLYSGYDDLILLNNCSLRVYDYTLTSFAPIVLFYIIYCIPQQICPLLFKAA
jgi:hypothetical protein